MEITISPWVRVLICLLKKCPNRRTRWSFFSHCRIAVDLCCIKVVVGDAIPRFRETGSHKERTHSGWPPCSTPAQDRFLALIAHRNQFRTALLLKRQWQYALGRDVSTSTVKRTLFRTMNSSTNSSEVKVIFVICPGTVNQEDYVNIVGNTSSVGSGYIS